MFLTIQSRAQNKELIKALKQHAHPIATATPLSDNSDLTFLKDVLKDKTVIGLGEATHGTREFFQMKHRLVKFLVEEMGYRQFAIESNFAECMAINDYVRDGIGDPEMALRGIY
ncbi:MAG: erythromycin esterase family protein, partial [Taibaiella sp.]|nr:erythromycin esterase family protein [Taibaiella sp.]